MSWPFFNNQLITGNPKSNVAICTLWSEKKTIIKDIPKEFYNVAGNLYTPEGINYIIKNILSNPVINHIVLCGKDVNGSGKAFLNFMENGIDGNKKIHDSNSYVHKNIPENLIQIFRNNVTVTEINENHISQFLRKLNKTIEHFTKPVNIEDEPFLEKELTTNLVGFKFNGSLRDVWISIMDVIFKFGETKSSQHGLEQKEVLDVMAVIEKGFDIGEFPWIEKSEMDNYIDGFFSKAGKNLAYTYGDRIFRYTSGGNETDQIEGVVHELKQALYTRRAAVSLWNPFMDSSNENPPCLTQIMWLVKNNKLYQTCTFRSHDIAGAYILNIFALRKIQKMVAEKINMELGDLIVLSHSAHIYSDQWPQMKTLIEEYKPKITTFDQDIGGYFRIWLENGKIIVQHYLNDGRKTDFCFKGLTSTNLYRKILSHNLITKMDHAAYIGKELGRAEEYLKTGQSYEMDKA